MYPLSSRMDRNKNNVTMTGRNPSTLPTPPQMPSVTSELTIGLTSAAVSASPDGADHKVDARLQPIRQPSPKPAERHEEHEPHDENKARDGGEAPGQDAVCRHAADMLATFVRADDGARAEALDEREPHVRERRLAVDPP